MPPIIYSTVTNFENTIINEYDLNIFGKKRKTFVAIIYNLQAFTFLKTWIQVILIHVQAFS